MISILSIGNESTKKTKKKSRFYSIDISLVILGGDGSVINVINALIRHLAKENRTRFD